jgi:hypothetical protein
LECGEVFDVDVGEEAAAFSARAFPQDVAVRELKEDLDADY